MAHRSPSWAAAPLDSHSLAIRLPSVDRFPGLLDRSQYSTIGHGGFGHHVGGLGLEVHIEGLDACEGRLTIWTSGYFDVFFLPPPTWLENMNKESWGFQAKRVQNIPSSFLRTRSTAPEQPPQLMVTLNLY